MARFAFGGSVGRHAVHPRAARPAGHREFERGRVRLISHTRFSVSFNGWCQARSPSIRGGGMYGLKNVRNRRTDSLSRVGWDQLESLLAIYYRGQGCRVDHVGTGASGGRFDGGIDLKLHKDDEYIVVQCKHWVSRRRRHSSKSPLCRCHQAGWSRRGSVFASRFQSVPRGHRLAGRYVPRGHRLAGRYVPRQQGSRPRQSSANSSARSTKPSSCWRRALPRCETGN